jgi:hypothetical protein
VHSLLIVRAVVNEVMNLRGLAPRSRLNENIIFKYKSLHFISISVLIYYLYVKYATIVPFGAGVAQAV